LALKLLFQIVEVWLLGFLRLEGSFVEKAILLVMGASR
jgi:hypothetical protein